MEDLFDRCPYISKCDYNKSWCRLREVIYERCCYYKKIHGLEALGMIE